MAYWDSDACSAKFCDEEGTLLAAYFAKRIVRRSASQRRVGKQAPIYRSRSNIPSVLGRTAADVEAAAAGTNGLISEGVRTSRRERDDELPEAVAHRTRQTLEMEHQMHSCIDVDADVIMQTLEMEHQLHSCIDVDADVIMQTLEMEHQMHSCIDVDADVIMQTLEMEHQLHSCIDVDADVIMQTLEMEHASHSCIDVDADVVMVHSPYSEDVIMENMFIEQAM
ncbi:hypothetical protein C8R48DRAFT_782821 [Suillus tomentosus]|nr:hypothetical protein C8R48DRAFT_782821 [Suillus tomentosus]